MIKKLRKIALGTVAIVAVILFATGRPCIGGALGMAVVRLIHK